MAVNIKSEAALNELIQINNAFLRRLGKIAANNNSIQLFQIILNECTKVNKVDKAKRMATIQAEIQKQQTCIENADSLCWMPN